MNAGNLAIVFGYVSPPFVKSFCRPSFPPPFSLTNDSDSDSPTLMGTGTNVADAGWQVRVIDTILQNTYQIFDED